VSRFASERSTQCPLAADDAAAVERASTKLDEVFAEWI
jgi:hypothetical protein